MGPWDGIYDLSLVERYFVSGALYMGCTATEDTHFAMLLCFDWIGLDKNCDMSHK